MRHYFNFTISLLVFAAIVVAAAGALFYTDNSAAAVAILTISVWVGLIFLVAHNSNALRKTRKA